MKFLSLVLMAFLLQLGTASTIYAQTSTDPSDVVMKMVHHPDVQLTKVNGKVVVLAAGFCAANDCKAIFQPYEDVITVYLKEEAFMRGIKEYVVIQKYSPNELAFEVKQEDSRKLVTLKK